MSNCRELLFSSSFSFRTISKYWSQYSKLETTEMCVSGSSQQCPSGSVTERHSLPTQYNAKSRFDSMKFMRLSNARTIGQWVKWALISHRSYIVNIDVATDASYTTFWRTGEWPQDAIRFTLTMTNEMKIARETHFRIGQIGEMLSAWISCARVTCAWISILVNGKFMFSQSSNGHDTTQQQQKIM